MWGGLIYFYLEEKRYKYSRRNFEIMIQNCKELMKDIIVRSLMNFK